MNTTTHVRKQLVATLSCTAAFLLSCVAAAAWSADTKETRSSTVAISQPEEDESELIEERIRRYRQRHGVIPPEVRLRITREEYEKLKAEEARRSTQPDVEPAWVSLGPTNGAGRMTSIAAHPTAMGTLYVGADGGGAWKTTNGGNSWVSLTESINNLNVGAIAVAPSSPNTIYLGTGSEHNSGIGLLKSTDAGATWLFPASVVAGRFYRISVHPTNSQELIAGTDGGGGLRSTDGGVTWTTVISSTESVNDIVRDPTNPQILYAATFGCSKSCTGRISKSTDGGLTWVERSSGLPIPTPSQFVTSMSIAINPSNPLVLYVSFSIQDSDSVSHIYKTTNGAATWNELSGVSSDPNVNHYMGFQAFHDNTIVVSATNPNVVIAGGISYIRSTDAGVTWAGPPFSGSTVHVDATDLRYQGSTLYIANDGGIWSSPDNGETATSRNNGLVTREYYAMANDEVNRSHVFAGSQDNGTVRRPNSGGTAWIDVFGGDGFSCPINPNVPSIAYSTYQFGGILRTKDAANASTSIFMGSTEPFYPSGEGAGFGTLLTIDMKDPSILYTGTYRVWRTTDGGDSWAPLPTTTTDGSFWSSSGVDPIAVSRNNSLFLLVSKSDPSLGPVVFRSSNGGASWMRSETGLPFITNIDIDSGNSNIAYASVVDFSGNSVYMTTNAGASWAPRGTGLPSLPAQVVRINPTDSNILYCGTDAGVYRSTDQGLTWARYGVGLPSVSVSDLRMLEDGSVLRVATYGRGVWEIQFPTGNTPPSASITNPAAPLRVIKGTNILFQGSVSEPNIGDSATGIWTFTDTGETVSVGSGTSNVSHIFNRAGKFPVALTARDTHAARGSSSVVINVYEPFDNCATPRTIPNNGPFPYSITTNNEATEPQASDPTSCFGASSTLWFEFTPLEAGTYQFSVDRRIFNVSTVLSIWTGPKCGPYSAVPAGCEFDQVTVSAQAGVTLRIMADGLSPDVGRTFTLTVTPTPIPCVYSLSSGSQSFTSSGGSSSVDVAAPTACNWTALNNNPGFVTIDSGSGGSGNGTVNYFVAPNTGPARTGTITIAGNIFTIAQNSAPTNATIGVFFPSNRTFYLRNSNSPGFADFSIQYGPPGGMPLVGDWNGDGTTTIGVYDPSSQTFYLRNSNTPGFADLTIRYGPPGAVPIVGDWDGNGTATIGVYDSASQTFYLRNSNTPGFADLTIRYGPPGAVPVVGDWDGNATTTIGVYDPSSQTFYLRNSNTIGFADLTIRYGPSGATPVVGDWDANGTVTIGVYDPSSQTFYLRNSNTIGFANLTIRYGPSGATPLAGDWNGL